jgi:hypothetical protein
MGWGGMGWGKLKRINRQRPTIGKSLRLEIKLYSVIKELNNFLGLIEPDH